MFCPMCGAPNEEDATFCGNCGAALKEGEPEAAAVEAGAADMPAAAEEAPEAEEEAPAEPAVSEAPAEPAVPEAPLLPPLPPEPAAEPALPPPPPPAAQIVPTSGLAIASLVLGVGGLTVLPLLGSIAAIILGYMARNDIRRRPGEVTGDGMALAGIIMGWIPIALSVLVAVLALVGVVASICGFGLCGLTGGSW